MLRTSDFDYSLPQELIAQRPLDDRGAARMMVLPADPAAHGVAPDPAAALHDHVSGLPKWLRRGDLLVVNDTRVVPARLRGVKEGSGGQVELLLVRPSGSLSSWEALGGTFDGSEWWCLSRSSKPLREGAIVTLSDAARARVLGREEEGIRIRLEATSSLSEQPSVEALLGALGEVPLPPYIQRGPELADSERYQTVYARVPGSVAAPTAGLHLTDALLAQLDDAGVRRASVTLDVGPGTFLPVRADRLDEHRMHSERIEVPTATVEAVRETKARGGRVMAVGTTTVRALEGATDEEGCLRAGARDTEMFIHPGFTFRQIDMLLTNFHLPRSTLLMLVSAFGGTARMLAAYRLAVTERYRFFSYGDAMLIERAR